LLTLGCGVTLAAYGRPGLFVRATNDPSAKTWGPRAAVVDPAPDGPDTCAYSCLLPVDGRTALIAYSDFRHIGEDDQMHKSIKVREIAIQS